MQEIKQLSYFAADGKYGDATGLTIIDTTDWTADDWKLLKDVSEDSVPLAGRAVSEWIEKNRPTEDEECSFNFDKVGIKIN
jgi:hypothetical protein